MLKGQSENISRATESRFLKVFGFLFEDLMINLKKFLKTKKRNQAQSPLEISEKLSLKHKFLTGQASLEYFVLLSVIALLTLLSSSSFFVNVKASGEEVFQKLSQRILR